MAKSQNKLSPHAPQKQQKAQIEIGKRSKPAGDRQSPQTLSHPSGRGILTRRIWGLHLELGAGILELGAWSNHGASDAHMQMHSLQDNGHGPSAKFQHSEKMYEARELQEDVRSSFGTIEKMI